jgi:hypothetical protein
MSVKLFDRVAEISASTGTGDFVLSGAILGFRTFSSVYATNDTLHYAIEQIDGSGNQTGAWETGVGTFNGVGDLVRTTVIASSNAGALVNFTSGSKRVFVAPIAAQVASKGVAVINFHADAGANLTLTNQTNAELQLGGSTRNEMRFDASFYSQVRIAGRLETLSASVNNPRLYPQYFNGSTWVTVGAGTIASGEAFSMLTPAGSKFTNWITIPAAAQTDVLWRIAQNGGDGAADPALGNLSLQFR